MSVFMWNEACCVCRWPIWSDMEDEDGVSLIGWRRSESHPWCAPYRADEMLEDAWTG